MKRIIAFTTFAILIALAAAVLLRSGILVVDTDRLPFFRDGSVGTPSSFDSENGRTEPQQYFDPLSDPIDFQMIKMEGTQGIFPEEAYIEVPQNMLEAMRIESEEQIQVQTSQLNKYLEAKQQTPVSFGEPPTLWSPSCESLGEVQIDALGDIKDFYDDCSDVAIFDWSKWPANGGRVLLHFTGEVTSDFPELVAYLYAVRSHKTRSEMTDFRTSLVLESPGGDPYAAMSAGRAIFETFDTVWAGYGGCASACVFLLASGRQRSITGLRDHRLLYSPKEEDVNLFLQSFNDRKDRTIAIHSPLPVTDRSVSIEDLMNVRASFEADAKIFFSRFGVSSSIVDLMLTVPSEKARYLTLEELEAFGLLGENILAKELDRLEVMENCGRDFEARRSSFYAELENQCGHLMDSAIRSRDGDAPWMRCRNRVVEELNISKAVCPTGGFSIFSEDFISKNAQ